MEGKICTIYCFDVLQGGCIVESHDNILTAFGIDYDAIGLGKL